jgi:ABC-type phosphate transport system substrate-binding protein
MTTLRLFGSRARRATPATALGMLAVFAAGSAARGATHAPQAPVSAEAVVVVVSASSPVTEISRLHLADLYLGRRTRFPNGAPAVPIDQRAGTPARTAFSERYLGRSEAQLKAHWSRIIFTGRGRPPLELPDSEAVRTLVARDASAIGYLDARVLNASVRVVRVR